MFSALFLRAKTTDSAEPNQSKLECSNPENIKAIKNESFRALFPE